MGWLKRLLGEQPNAIEEESIRRGKKIEQEKRDLRRRLALLQTEVDVLRRASSE